MKKVIDNFVKLDAAKKKNIGIIAILIGSGFFLISFLFAEGYYPHAGLIGSFSIMEIVLAEGTYIENTYGGGGGYVTGRIAIPLKYPISLSIVIILFGIGVIALSKNNDKSL